MNLIEQLSTSITKRNLEIDEDAYYDMLEALKDLLVSLDETFEAFPPSQLYLTEPCLKAESAIKKALGI